MIVKDYPKDDEFRSVRISAFLVRRLERHIEQLGIGADEKALAAFEEIRDRAAQ